MTDLSDHAKRGGGDEEIILVADLPQRPPSEIVTATLVDHDEIGGEGFPQHGKFLKVRTPEGSTEYWECPGSMAGQVMAAADEMETEPEGAILSVTQVSKKPSGEWAFVLTLDPE